MDLKSSIWCRDIDKIMMTMEIDFHECFKERKKRITSSVFSKHCAKCGPIKAVAIKH